MLFLKRLYVKATQFLNDNMRIAESQLCPLYRCNSCLMCQLEYHKVKG